MSVKAQRTESFIKENKSPLSQHQKERKTMGYWIMRLLDLKNCHCTQRKKITGRKRNEQREIENGQEQEGDLELGTTIQVSTLI